jgi:hypothetical protein
MLQSCRQSSLFYYTMQTTLPVQLLFADKFSFKYRPRYHLCRGCQTRYYCTSKSEDGCQGLDCRSFQSYAEVNGVVDASSLYVPHVIYFICTECRNDADQQMRRQQTLVGRRTDATPPTQAASHEDQTASDNKTNKTSADACSSPDETYVLDPDSDDLAEMGRPVTSINDL